jgi:hypothetical protein
MLQPSNSFFYLASNVLVIPALAAAPRIRDADEASAAARSVRRLGSFQQYFPAAERPAADAPHQSCAFVKRTIDCGEPALFLVCLNA